MKRGGPLKRSDKPMAQGGLSSANNREVAVWDALLSMGCAVCHFHLRIEDSPAEIHHILAGQRRISHSHVLPLCSIHHRQGTAQHPSRHSVNGCHGGLDIFERTYGTEMELVLRCEEWINQPYLTGLLTDEQAPQDVDTESKADSERVGGSGDSVPSEDADMEPDFGHESLGAETVQRFITPVRISVHHYRHRLCDADAPSIKAALDGIVHTGVLRDDSTKEIHEIRHRQFKIPATEAEKTIFKIEAVV